MNSGPCISLPHLNIGACVLLTTTRPQPWLRTFDCVVVALHGRWLLGKKVERGGAASAAGVEFYRRPSVSVPAGSVGSHIVCGGGLYCSTTAHDLFSRALLYSSLLSSSCFRDGRMCLDSRPALTNPRVISFLVPLTIDWRQDIVTSVFD